LISGGERVRISSGGTKWDKNQGCREFLLGRVYEIKEKYLRQALPSASEGGGGGGKMNAMGAKRVTQGKGKSNKGRSIALELARLLQPEGKRSWERGETAGRA